MKFLEVMIFLSLPLRFKCSISHVSGQCNQVSPIKCLTFVSLQLYCIDPQYMNYVLGIRENSQLCHVSGLNYSNEDVISVNLIAPYYINLRISQ